MGYSQILQLFQQVIRILLCNVLRGSLRLLWLRSTSCHSTFPNQTDRLAKLVVGYRTVFHLLSPNFNLGRWGDCKCHFVISVVEELYQPDGEVANPLVSVPSRRAP